MSSGYIRRRPPQGAGSEMGVVAVMVAVLFFLAFGSEGSGKGSGDAVAEVPW